MATILDLQYYIPEKFRDKPIISTLVDELNEIMGEWIDDIAGLAGLANPEDVPEAYLQYLGDLIGTVLTSEDNATAAERRKELIRSIDWIKIKGTYESLNVIALITGRAFELKDMYTNDYVTFVLKDWWVATAEGQNPPGLDASYYKSSHFGLLIRLNVKHSATTTWVYDYLWIPAMFSNLDEYVEKTRPIHTVPHYYVLFESEADDNGEMTTVEGEIHTAIVGTWTVTKQYFDQDTALGSGEGWNFDDGENFDVSQDAFYNGITKWVMGTGNKASSPEDSGWSGAVDSSVLTGTVDSIEITADKIVWRFTVSAQIRSGLSELGLYTPGTPDVLRVISMFPEINLGGNVDMQVVVTVNRV